MKPIYIYDIGVKPWEQTVTISDGRFATITVVHRSISDLFNLWLVLASTISQRLPRCLKWRTIGHSVEGSKVQELNFVKQLKADLSSDDFLDKNSDSNIYSYIKQLPPSINEFDLNTITQSRYTALLFLPDGEPSKPEIWEILKSSDGGLKAAGMERLMRAYNGLLICRLFESDTHVSLQLIGFVEQVDFFLEKLNELEVERVEERDIAKLINDKGSAQL
jgi:hypothetical protein